MMNGGVRSGPAICFRTMTNTVLPADHDARIARALLSLEGLSVGDAFGQRFFGSPAVVERLIASRVLPHAPWRYTDDTEMALAITDVLACHGTIDRDALARAFALRYVRNPTRGYGGTAHTILSEIAKGRPWREAAAEPFEGQGSMGNGAAMRVAPVGAYFADDVSVAVSQARASAEVTHAHPEGQAGAIAVATAALFAWRSRHAPEGLGNATLLSFVHEHTPEGATRAGIERAMAIALGTEPREVAASLGSGERVLAEDTVPFALWCAARHLDDFEEAMWTTLSGLGDRDTTCAIVGGIVVLASGLESIPAEWRAAREPLERGVC